MRRLARANVTPIRQMTQFTCVSTSTCMALNALGVKCSEEQVNEVIGAKPMQGSRWEEVLACAQYFGCRATLTTPATLTQVKEWTDQGKPVLIAWNPEGRDWSHASLIFDVTGEKGNFIVHIADPNIPNPDKTVREVEEDEFYSKWFEKWPNYLVRRPALMIDREITPEGRQVMASITAGRKKKKRKKRRPRNEMPKFRDPNTSGMFEGGVGSSGKGVHQNRDRDVQRGSSRKEKHKGREDKYAKKVFFQGRKLSISTIKGYASDPESPYHEYAKNFFAKRKEKRETTETWLDRKMDKEDKKMRIVFDSRRNPMTKPVHLVTDNLKGVVKKLSREIPKPSVAFSSGFNAFANPTKENTETMKKNISYAAKEMFKGVLKKGEEEKIADCLVEAKKSAMQALGEASKALADQTARFGISTMTGLFYAGLSVSGKAVAGGAWMAPTAVEYGMNIFELNKLDRVKVSAKKEDPMKVLEEGLDAMFNVFGKDEAKAISKFIDKDGNFDQRGYMKEIEKAIKEIKSKAEEYVNKVNEEAKQKSASVLVRRYLNG